MEVECIHGMESGCENCLHPERFITRKKKEPKKSRVKAIHAKPDPATSKALDILDGVWCAKCDTPRDDHGFCACERNTRMHAELAAMRAWYDAQPEKTKKAAGWVLLQGSSRAVLRSGRDEPAGIAGSMVPMGAAVGYETRDIVGLDAKWQPYRNTVADEIPV